LNYVNPIILYDKGRLTLSLNFKSLERYFLKIKLFFVIVDRITCIQITHLLNCDAFITVSAHFHRGVPPALAQQWWTVSPEYGLEDQVQKKKKPSS
jgi:hypothetical protein